MASPNSLLFFAASAVTLAPIASGEPPSSVDPPAAAKLHVTYTHALTQACAAERTGKELVCRAQTAPLPGTTSLTVVPVETGLQVGRKKDPRQPLGINVDAKNPAYQSLPAGRWRVAWPGYEAEPTFFAAVGQTVELRLSLVEGRCEPGASECRIVSGVVRRHAEVVNAR